MPLSAQATALLNQYNTYANNTANTVSDAQKQLNQISTNPNDPSYTQTLNNVASQLTTVKDSSAPYAMSFGLSLNATAASLSGQDLSNFNQQRMASQNVIDSNVALTNTLLNKISGLKNNKPLSQQSKKTVQEDDASKKQNNQTSVVKAPARPYNPLSKYSSSTYRIGLYMVSPDQSIAYSNTGKWDLNKLTLIVQSGGITKSANEIRSPYFGLDLYIDDLEINTVVNPKELGYSSTSYDMRFKIFEPYGISFTTNLVNAAIQVQQNSVVKKKLNQPISALTMQYLLAIHFYGYDDQGNIMKGEVNNDGTTSGGANGAAYERLFPVTLTGVSFKLENKMSVYDIKANMIDMQVGFDKLRGNVPDSTTVAGDTVQSALNALADSLNKKQQSISSQTDTTKKQSLPDIYKFEFAPNTTIGDSPIVDKSHFVASNTPMPYVLNTLNINVRLSESGKSEVVQKQKREFTFPAMMPMASAVDQIITQSDFLIKALKVVDVEQIQKTSDLKPDYVTNASPDPLVWYHMTPKIKIIDFDEKRNDFAYEITYYITEYKVPYVRSTAVTNTSTYEGPFKVYDYWYTGHNTEIIEYNQNYNLLYFVTGSASSLAANANNNDPTKTKDLVSSGSSSTGMAPGAKEGINTIRTALYSPGDSVSAHIKILGDPDYLATTTGNPPSSSPTDQSATDYTLNPGYGQTFIEVGFKQVSDYDNNTGLISPNNNIFFWDYTDDIKKKTDRMIYMVITLKSVFSKGMFTQELKTILPPFTNNTDQSQPTDQRSTDTSAPQTKVTPPGLKKYIGNAGRGANLSTDPRLSLQALNPQNVSPTQTDDDNGDRPVPKYDPTDIRGD